MCLYFDVHACVYACTLGYACVRSLFMQAMHRDFASTAPALLIGMDGNTYKTHSAQYQGVEDLQALLVSHGLSSVWGAKPDPLSPTTCNARTYLQPQLNTAVSKDDAFLKGDVNLKDWIVFAENQWAVVNGSTSRDNMGRKGEAVYTEDMVFPTLDFPSDHAVVATTLSLAGGAATDSVCLFH